MPIFHQNLKNGKKKIDFEENLENLTYYIKYIPVKTKFDEIDKN